MIFLEILRKSVCRIRQASIILILISLLFVCVGCDIRIRQNDRNTLAYYNEYVELLSDEDIWTEKYVLVKDSKVICASSNIDVGDVIFPEDHAEQLSLLKQCCCKWFRRNLHYQI